jgi:pilus assembly protein CpaC
MKIFKRPTSLISQSTAWTLLMLLAGTMTLGLPRSAFSAEDDSKAKPSAEASDSSETSESDDASDEAKSEDLNQQKITLRGKKKNPKRSRLTSDTSEDEADRRRLLLTTGEDKTVDLDFDANTRAEGITVGNPLLVATTLVKVGDKRQIVFKPLKAGETNVIVRDADGNIRLIFMVRITGSNLLRIAGEIRDLLRDVEGMDIRIVGPKIILEGEVLVPADYGRVAMIVADAAYNGFVMNLTTLSPLGMSVLAKKIESDIKNFAPNVTTRVVNGVIFLEGSVKNVDEARRANDIALIYLPDVKPTTLIERDDKTSVKSQIPRKLLQNFIQIEPPPPKKQEKLVRVTVHFVELSKDYSKFFGFKWEPGFTSEPTIAIGQGTSGSTQAGGMSFSATISSLLPKLKSAQDAGYARVLKTGTVIVRSGQPAKLDELTQFPYVVSGPNGQTTPAAQPVGLSVGVTPLILGQSEDIQMDLNMNQIDLVSLPSNGGPPITSTHKVETKIYVKSKESAAVAGVNSTDVGTSFNKDDPNPGTFSSGSGGATTDAMFTLKHTKNYSKKKSQFVIFVTPEIIDNASEGSEDLKRNFRVKVK